MLPPPSDDYLILKVPKPMYVPCKMHLIALSANFQFTPPLDGSIVTYNKFSNVAEGFGTGIIEDPDVQGMALVCYGQNVSVCGDYFWAVSTGPAYAKCCPPKEKESQNAESE
jgi:hypothetical protein